MMHTDAGLHRPSRCLCSHQQPLAPKRAAVPVCIAVLADQLQALRSAPTEEGAREALGVFAPLANRLGVWSIKAELEDLAFKVGALPRTWALPLG